LDLGEEDDLTLGLDNRLDANTTIGPDGTIIEMPADDGFQVNNVEDDDLNASGAPSPAANFDETTAPLIHPADSGPVSLGTKHAVHLLRDRFGPEAASSPDKRKKGFRTFPRLASGAEYVKSRCNEDVLRGTGTGYERCGEGGAGRGFIRRANQGEGEEGPLG